jgi:hypothetical protein
MYSEDEEDITSEDYHISSSEFEDNSDEFMF